MGKNETALLILSLVPLFASALLYQFMPGTMDTHWNAEGIPDGAGDRLMGVFMLPALTVFLTALLLFVPRIDPLRKDFPKYRTHYHKFILVFILFMALVHTNVILWNLGHEISPAYIMPVGLGILFYYVGVLCENAKRNWFIGIRTPWTMSSDAVWAKTHRQCGRLFRLCAGLAVISPVAGAHSIYLAIVPPLLAAAYLMLYSYMEYRKETRAK